MQGLPAAADTAAFKELFGKFGEILDCKVLLDKEGKSRRSGLVNIKDAASAQKCIREMNDKRTEDGSLMYVQKHLPKKELQH